MTYNSMKKLIERKFYETQDKALELLDVFLMANRITQDQYMELMLLAAEQYKEEEPAE